MTKFFNKRSILICNIFPSFLTQDVDFEQYKVARGLYIEDPWERVKSIFSRDEHGNRHPELEHSIQMAELGLMIGIFYGGLTDGIRNAQNYVHRSDTSIFQNKKEAYKVIGNYTVFAFLKEGIRWAPVFGIFFGSFFLVSSCCEAYRNKPRVSDSLIAGAVVGSISKFMFGIKGMISGGVVGGVLGALYGASIWCFSKLTNTDQLQLKYVQFAMANYRKNYKIYNTETKAADIVGECNTDLHSVHVENPLNQLELPIEEEKSKTNESTSEKKQ